MYLYRDIYDANIELAKAEKDQEYFKLDLNEITRGNPKKKSADQIKTIENIKNLYKSRQKVIDLFNDFVNTRSKAKYATKHDETFSKPFRAFFPELISIGCLNLIEVSPITICFFFVFL